MSKQTVELFAKVVRLLFIVHYIAGQNKKQKSRKQQQQEAKTRQQPSRLYTYADRFKHIAN